MRANSPPAPNSTVLYSNRPLSNERKGPDPLPDKPRVPESKNVPKPSYFATSHIDIKFDANNQNPQQTPGIAVDISKQGKGRSPAFRLNKQGSPGKFPNPRPNTNILNQNPYLSTFDTQVASNIQANNNTQSLLSSFQHANNARASVMSHILPSNLIDDGKLTAVGGRRHLKTSFKTMPVSPNFNPNLLQKKLHQDVFPMEELDAQAISHQQYIRKVMKLDQMMSLKKKMSEERKKFSNILSVAGAHQAKPQISSGGGGGMILVLRTSPALDADNHQIKDGGQPQANFPPLEGHRLNPLKGRLFSPPASSSTKYTSLGSKQDGGIIFEEKRFSGQVGDDRAQMIISSHAPTPSDQNSNEYAEQAPITGQTNFKKAPRTVSRLRTTAKSQQRQYNNRGALLNASQDENDNQNTTDQNNPPRSLSVAFDGMVQQEINGYVAAKQLSLSLYQNSNISPSKDYAQNELADSFMPMAAARQSPIRRFKLPRSFLKTPGLVNSGKMSYLGQRPLSPQTAPHSNVSQESVPVSNTTFYKHIQKGQQAYQNFIMFHKSQNQKDFLLTGQSVPPSDTAQKTQSQLAKYRKSSQPAMGSPAQPPVNALHHYPNLAPKPSSQFAAPLKPGRHVLQSKLSGGTIGPFGVASQPNLLSEGAGTLSSGGFPMSSQ